MEIVYTNDLGDEYPGHIQLLYPDGIHADIQVMIDHSSKFFENIPHVSGARGAWEYVDEEPVPGDVPVVESESVPYSENAPTD